MADVQGGRIVWKLDVDDSQFNAQLARAGVAANALGRTVGNVGNVARAGIGSGLAGALAHVSTFTGQASTAFNNVATGISSFASRFKLVGVAAAAAAAATVGFGLKFGSDLQVAATRMQALTGSTQVAQKLFTNLYNFVRGTSLSFPDVAQAASTLLGYGRTAQQVESDIKVLGGAVSITGANFGLLASVYGQVNAAGRLMGQDSLQLINNGIPITTQLSKDLGISMVEVKKRIEEGAISAEMFNKAMENFVPDDAIERMKNTMPGALSNLAGSFRIFAFSLLGIDYSKFVEGEGLLEVQGGLFQQIRLGIIEVSKALSSVDTKRAMAKLGDQVSGIAKIAIPALVTGLKLVINNMDTLIALGAAVAGAWAFAKVTSGLLGMVSVITNVASVLMTAAKAGALFSLAISANPIGLIAAAITAVVGALIFLELKFGLLTAAFNAIKPAIDAFISSLTMIWSWISVNILPTLTRLWSILVAQLVPAWNQLVAAIRPYLPLLQQFAVLLAVGIAVAVGIFIATILVAATIVLTVANIFISAVNMIRNAWNSAWNAIRNVVNAQINFIRGIITAGVGAFIATWSAITRIVGVVAGAMSGVINAVRGGVQSALNAVRGFIGSFVSLGADIVNGIINGILGVAGRIADTLKNIAKGALDAAKAAVGAHSPSTLFAREVGLPIAQGIALGIMQGAGEINSALASVTSPGSTSGMQIGAEDGTVGAGGASVVINAKQLTEADIDMGANRAMFKAGQMLQGSS